MKRFFLYICVFVLMGAFVAGCQNKNVPPEPPAVTENKPAQAEVTPAPVAAEPDPGLMPEPEPEPEDSFWPIGFETGTEGFTGRGDEKVEQHSYAHEGDYSLYVYDRTQSWNGAIIDVTDVIKKGVEYEFSLWVCISEADPTTNFILSAQVNAGESESYSNLTGSDAKKSVNPAEWTYLSGKIMFTGYDRAQLYVETGNNGKVSFYVDDVNLVPTGEVIDMTAEDLPSLKEIYKDYFLIGCAGEAGAFDPDSISYAVMSNTFNAITPENSMKPQSVQGQEGAFTFASADGLVKAAKANGMTVIGHTLAWHQQSPGWINASGMSREDAIKNLENHIKETVSHFGDDVYSWDVVNEAFSDSITNPGNWKYALRDCPWKSAIGDDYIEIAFKAAREANPNIKLYYNDYNLDYPDKREAVYYMAKDFIARGIPIDGIGMQGHYNLSTSAAEVEKSIALFADLGLLVSVTELDVSVSNAGAALSAEAALNQAVRYAELFQVFRKYAGTVERVTLWGISDGASWRAANFPLLFDKFYKAKPAFYAVVDPDGYLEENRPARAIAETRKARAVYGTPVIGGDEAAWDKAQEINVNNYVMAWQGATGTARVLWDENNLYILFKVSDSVLSDAAKDTYNQDSIEVFVDENNAKTGSYEKGDGQFRVNYKNELSFNPNKAPEKGECVSSAEITAGGYTVQLAIPFQTVTPKDGMTIGFDLQINDANEAGQRVSIAKWNDLTDNSFRSTEGFGQLVLSK